jgi:transposase
MSPLTGSAAARVGPGDWAQLVVPNALGNSVLTVAYHLLTDPEARFDDLGPGFYESRINTNRRARNLATQLQAITGQKIVIRDGKAVVTESAA